MIDIKFIKNYFFILFSIIPISIVAGPAISLINIIIIDISFIFYVIFRKDFKFLKNSTIKIILAIYIYLIFNSFISLDSQIGLNRNLGFIRFIIFFICFNYFFYLDKKFKKIFIYWILAVLIICLDVYLESFKGTNLLGYGGQEYGRRIVSFFKDEPIAGAYINGFFLILISFWLLHYKSNSLYQNLSFLIFVSLIFFSIILTGERSNSIKAFIGLILFFFFVKEFTFKTKIVSFLSIGILFTFIYINSDFLKLRYGWQIIYQITKQEKIENFYKNDLYFKIYRSGYSVFKNYPYFGVGNKNYRVETCDTTKINKDYICTTHPHQIYFEFLSEHGLLGSLFLISAIFLLMFKNFKIFFKLRNPMQIGSFIYLIIIFLPLLPSGSFFHDFNLTLFWLNMSIFYGLSTQTNIFSKK